eukprot:TRINITY_DN63147_c0_g1_i1.p1 TRINITY_DN63147_c0_g1~~TRINITY_DN63147_c0_g1_i1.p1  ORF type:complete len:242 (+),score=28.63 TRINITY_DN63147_c0_g1_i1:82-807(+)
MKFHTQLAPLVSLTSAFSIAFAYVMLGLAGNRIMANRTPMELTVLKFFYNLAQILVCSLTFMKLLPFFVAAPHGFGINMHPHPDVEWWVFVFYCCKLLDFGDTVFMVLGKKTRQFTLLHVWHHASIVPLFSYYLSTGLGAGSLSALPLLNSAVHVLMYSHYLITSLMTFKRMWWKPLITSSQMGHHVILILLMTVNWVYGNPEITLAVVFWGILWGVSILGLFAHFYWEQYMSAGRKRKEG